MYADARQHQVFHISTTINDDVVEKDIDHVLMSDRNTNCDDGMTPHIIYNRIVIRGLLFGALFNNLIKCEPANVASFMHYGFVMRTKDYQQTSFMVDEYDVFALRNGVIVYGDCTLNFSQMNPLAYDMIFLFKDANNVTISQFSRHGYAIVGCFNYSTLTKYPDKLCIRSVYIQNDICSARKQNDYITIRTYIDFGGDRTQRKWLGKFKLNNVQITYNSTAP